MIRLLLLFSILSFELLAQENPDSFFQMANDAYQANNFNEAIQQYEKVIALEASSAELHYNLGNAYYKAGQLGKAILNYERAKVLDPRSEDIQYNLDLAEKQRADDIEVLSSFFLERWWNNWKQSLGSGTWAFLSLLILWIGIGGLLYWLFGNVRQYKKWGLIGGVIAIIISLLPLALGFSRAKFEVNSGTAIIVEQRVDLKSGPDMESTRILTIHEGTKVALLDKIGAWYKVRLTNGEQGWLEQNDLEEI